MHGIATRVRPRPVDNYKRLVIYRDASELQFDDDGAAELSQAKKKRMIDLPIPAVSDVSDYANFTAGAYVAPVGYVRRRIREEMASEGADVFPAPSIRPDDWIEYDLDADDMNWYSNVCKSGPSHVSDAKFQMSIAFFERVMDHYEHVAGRTGHGATIAQQEAVGDMFRSLTDTSVTKPSAPTGLNNNQLHRLLEEVYSYWNQKRTKLKKPLLRRYWQPTPPGDTDPHRVFRPHEKVSYRLRRTRRNDTDSYTRLLNFRSDLVFARQLVDSIRSREMLKRDLVTVSEDILEQTIDVETNLSGKPRVPVTLAERSRKKESTKMKLRLLKSATTAASYPATIQPQYTRMLDEAASVAESMDDNDDDGDYTGRPRMSLNKAPRTGIPKAPAAKRESTAVAPAQKPPKKTTAAPSAQPAQAAGAAPGTTPSGPSFHPYGLNPQAALQITPGMPPPQNTITFYPGYQGLQLGPWSLPRTVPAHHVEEALFEHEDTLAVGPAKGLRLGVPATYQQVEAGVRGLAYTVLPSGSHAFPMDQGYVVPDDPEVNRADATVQRRMLVARTMLAVPGLGGISWEQGSGSGLVRGIGSGFGVDGRGWESAGARLEASLMPFDDVRGATTEGLGFLPPEKKEASPPSPAVPKSDAMDEDTEEDLPTVTGRNESAGVNDEEWLSRLAIDKDWIVQYLRECTTVVGEEQGQQEGSLGLSSTVPRKRSRAVMAMNKPKYILRPRISRGGRIVLDRIRLHRPQLHRHLNAHAAALDARLQMVKRDKRRLWRQLVEQAGSKAADALQALQRATGIPSSRMLAEEDLNMLSNYELHEAAGYSGTAVDPHALHIALFSHYTTAGSSAVLSSMEAHQRMLDRDGKQANFTNSRTVSVRGLSSCFLAPSKFTRVGDEMIPIKQSLEALSSIAHQHNPVESRKVTEDPTLLLPPEFDPFYDDAFEEMCAYRDQQHAKHVQPSLRALTHGTAAGALEPEDDGFDMVNLRDFVDAVIDDEFGIDDDDDDADNRHTSSANKRLRPTPDQPTSVLDKMTYFERQRLVNPRFQGVFAEFSSSYLPGLVKYIDDIADKFPGDITTQDVNTGSVFEHVGHAHALPDTFGVVDCTKEDRLHTAGAPLHVRPSVAANAWLQDKGIPVAPPDDASVDTVTAPEGMEGTEEDEEQLLASVPRDAYGIPILGAHTGADKNKLRVRDSRGATHKVPQAAVATYFNELFGPASTANTATLSHALGPVAAGQQPTQVPLVSQQPGHKFDSDKFCEFFKRENVGNTEDGAAAVSGWMETGVGGELAAHWAQRCLEDIQLGPLLENLDADKGT